MAPVASRVRDVRGCNHAVAPGRARPHPVLRAGTVGLREVNPGAAPAAATAPAVPTSSFVHDASRALPTARPSSPTPSRRRETIERRRSDTRGRARPSRPFRVKRIADSARTKTSPLVSSRQHGGRRASRRASPPERQEDRRALRRDGSTSAAISDEPATTHEVSDERRSRRRPPGSPGILLGAR